MKTTMTLLILCSTLAFAQTKEATKDTTKSTVGTHQDMHETMAKAHQAAADCLKAGKPEEECREQFRASCQSGGGPEFCGMGMGRGMGPGRKMGRGK